MNTPIKFQTIFDEDGKPAFVVVPYHEFVLKFDRDAIPNEVAGMVLKDGMTLARAWREHLGVTQDELARRMGISQSAVAQFEAADKPRLATRRKIAAALGVSVEQIS